MNVTAEEVVALLQQKFPQEFEICVLTIQNQKLLAHQRESEMTVEEETSE